MSVETTADTMMVDALAVVDAVRGRSFHDMPVCSVGIGGRLILVEASLIKDHFRTRVLE